ncbi:threonine dehydratase [Aetokthonos hydrillicola Thurmond2011]|jgi:hypothetical protein|uniref:Threonine dehydratase n=1 Tax=Aetokthonos hydrillicola Thurmond2011 TaxID=2712845 RepID=A0AAP5IFA5_9CYAN|nr:threonine dehydratase [Aetokthonos hydrillicola]MBO3463875.1 threonine dehydratase [Aetokthonos hydrillicola CCALA 1050]MBW4584248.1 threonine dehydratase [Aetokthonos hydrillicola CCALA 1050]MDR9898543.1 threonine dehydratase [Aetokthonos hydrillicola Thurmond2011]
MFRLNQTLRNLFIRIEAFFSVLFKNVFGLFAGFFGLLGRLSGFSKSEYFLESNEPKSTKSSQTQESTASNGSTTTRRRPNSRTDDYFLNMAKEVKKS